MPNCNHEYNEDGICPKCGECAENSVGEADSFMWEHPPVQVIEQLCEDYAR